MMQRCVFKSKKKTTQNIKFLLSLSFPAQFFLASSSSTSFGTFVELSVHSPSPFPAFSVFPPLLYSVLLVGFGFPGIEQKGQ